MFEKLKLLKSSSLLRCDKNDLVDINDIVIDTTKPKEERMLEFLCKIKNPYLFKSGDIVVKIVYSNNDLTLQHQMESLVQSNIGK